MLTVVLIVADLLGQEHIVRALLDSASQPSLISDRMVQILQLKRKKVNVQLQGAGRLTVQATESVFAQIRSRRNDFTRDVDFLVLPQVTAKTPERTISVADWNIPNDVFLADPHFNESAGIDMIIGLGCLLSDSCTTLVGERSPLAS